jgi:hypothetical protein
MFSGDFEKPVIPLFIQLPRENTGSIKNPKAYDEAYMSFEKQAKEVLTKWVEKSGNGADLTKVLEQQFIRIPSKNLSTTFMEMLIKRINSFLNPEFVSNVETLVSAGMSISDAIDSVLARAKEDGVDTVPGLFVNQVKNTLCENNPEQCNDKLIEKVNLFYISKNNSDKIEKEILMRKRDLESWEKILEAFNEIGTGRNARDAAPQMLQNSISSNLRINLDPYTSSQDDTLGKMLQKRAGLPTGFASPLLNYQIEEIGNKNQVKLCEFATWVRSATDKLEIIKTLRGGIAIPKYKIKEQDLLDCPEISEKGKELTLLDQDSIGRTLLNLGETEEYSYSFPQSGQRFFWIPVKHLP